MIFIFMSDYVTRIYILYIHIYIEHIIFIFMSDYMT